MAETEKYIVSLAEIWGTNQTGGIGRSNRVPEKQNPVGQVMQCLVIWTNSLAKMKQSKQLLFASNDKVFHGFPWGMLSQFISLQIEMHTLWTLDR